MATSTTKTKTRETYKKKKEKVDLYQTITDRIIAKLKEGTVPWVRPWSAGKFELAYNYVSKKEYRGVNRFMLNFMRPTATGGFISFKQAKELGGKIRKGAKSEMVFFFSVLYSTTDGTKISEETAKKLKAQGQSVRVMPFLKYSRVFNLDDVEGIEGYTPEIKTYEHEPEEAAEAIVKGYTNGPAIVETQGSSNHYAPKKDQVAIMPRNRFKSAAAYYGVVFHELTHSTGHESRLDREGITAGANFKSKTYAREELTAELGAAFLCALTGVNQEVDNSAAYIQSWLTALENDNRLVYKAATQAQAAVDHITGERKA